MNQNMLKHDDGKYIIYIMISAYVGNVVDL